jgi:hypothetical protein
MGAATYGMFFRPKSFQLLVGNPSFHTACFYCGMSAAITLPFYTQLPAGVALPPTGSGQSSTSSNATSSSSASSGGTPSIASQAPSNPVDTVNIRPVISAGAFSAEQGDAFSLSTLLQGIAAQASTISGYEVALPANSGGQLLLNGQDVTTQGHFTAAQFADLQFIAGNTGTTQNILVVAQSSTGAFGGGLVDSPAVQLTANVTGTRSLNALPALQTPADAQDQQYVTLAQEASIFTGTGTNRPSLSTVGNFTAQQGDAFNLSTLVQGNAPSGATISDYEVALAANSDGKLLLNGQDVTSQGTFTASQYADLQFVAGSAGSAQNILVVAQSNENGLVDSQATQISASVTGTRSLNALPALQTEPDAQDQQYISLAQEASIYTGTGTNRPSLSTVGNFTAQQGDAFNLSTLVQGTAAQGSTINTYEVALAANSGGTLLLNGQDVTSQGSFTAAQFADLQYIAGSDGTNQNILVVAQTGAGGLVDSPAVEISASVTGTRSLNALPALQTQPDAQNQQYIALAQETNIFTGTGSNRPSLSTVGNFTAEQGDAFNLSTLVQGTAAPGKAISDYEVALAALSGGTLMLNGQDVTNQGTFTAAQFADLQYIAGSAGTAENILVAAQTSDGGLVDSPAVQITASVTGARSLNALPALQSQPDAQDEPFTSLAQEASIFTGTGTNRPSLSTQGNFTAQAGDAFNLSTLVQGSAASGTTISDYEVALSALSDGTLMLNGQDVTNQGTFTAAQFDDLQYIAGSTGTAQNILVAAQANNGGLVDSPAVQITASVTGTRSLNAIPALQTEPDAQDQAYISLAQEASIFTGTGSNRPNVETILGTDPPQQPDPTAVGAFQETGASSVTGGSYDANAFDPSGIGGFEQTGTLADAALNLYDLLFPQDGIGGSITVGNTNLQSVAINSYLKAQST